MYLKISAHVDSNYQMQYDTSTRFLPSCPDFDTYSSLTSESGLILIYHFLLWNRKGNFVMRDKQLSFGRGRSMEGRTKSSWTRSSARKKRSSPFEIQALEPVSPSYYSLTMLPSAASIFSIKLHTRSSSPSSRVVSALHPPT